LLIPQLDLFIGPDSGPLHLFDQASVSCIGLYGPTSPVSWGLIGPQSVVVTQNLPCSPCYKDDGNFPACPYGNRCMQEISVEQVLGQISLLLPEYKKHSEI